ncbi:hypothetical protein RDWZM_009468 [Blomia tropicalis]|uniref:inositol-1,4-bisphosphate 1-phosphatase n=1 Tax=Blomia tropicalis TaxID=40697 RepID=A0A9Q0M303_BLOTA|nr:Inositol polyphosphate 1-phosphatase [Blomia tropicalis]KAJ6218311.1 hypothetical protein RDWZM_009468 [Blomia tropicalis]
MIIAAIDLLGQLIDIAEKAAKIARLCRAENGHLFSLLIQEKSNEQKNPRFIRDFKTFADVLIQEVAKYWLETKFVGLSHRVYGEETNHFENKLGESITVQIESDRQKTRSMLMRILDGNDQIADSLLDIIYGNDCTNTDQITASKVELELNDIAVWIDPIDSTSEYINGRSNHGMEPLSPHGLHCVTCLFGVYHTKTGLPVMGVLNQPFYKSNDNDLLNGRCIWGFQIDGICRNNLPECSDSQTLHTRPILIGGHESDEIVNKLNRISSTLYVAGAGYKLLCVILSEAYLLVTSSKTTFYWDTCAGHAILRSLGGGVVPLDDIIQMDSTEKCLPNQLERLQVKYGPKNGHISETPAYNHNKGLVAYQSIESMHKVVKTLQR